jgi:hypothetical protein
MVADHGRAVNPVAGASCLTGDAVATDVGPVGSPPVARMSKRGWRGRDPEGRRPRAELGALAPPRPSSLSRFPSKGRAVSRRDYPAFVLICAVALVLTLPVLVSGAIALGR